MSEQFAFQQACRDGRTIELHEGPFPSIAEIVKRPSDQLFSAAGLTENQDRRRRGGNRLHFLQHAPQRLAVAHDLLKVVLSLNFLLKVQLLLGQLVLELGDLFVTPVRFPPRWPPARRSGLSSSASS